MAACVEPGAVDQDIGFDATTGCGLDAVRKDAGDGVGHQFDVVALERPEPVAVVHQHALARRRIGRHALCEQFRVVADHLLDVRGQHGAQLIVGLADGAVGVVPGGVAPDHRQQPLARLPEHVEPEPLGVERHVVQEPVLLVADVVVVLGPRRYPRRRALEDGYALGDFGDLRDRLKRAGAGADDDDALAFEIVCRLPLRGVECGAVEGAEALDVRELRAVELPHRRDDRVGVDHVLAVGSSDLHLPVPVVYVARFEHFRGQPNVVPDVEFGCDPVEVVEQDVLAREVLRPVVGCERVRVGVVRAVHAAARISVLEPGAADVRVLVDDGVADAGLLELDRREETGHAGADHEDVELAPLCVRHVVERHPVGVFVEDLQFGREERAVAGVEFPADDEVDHLLDEFGRRRRRCRAACLAVGDQRGEAAGANGGLVGLRNAALGIAEHLARRMDVAANERGIAGHVDQRVDERRDVRFLERCLDGLIVRVDRIQCVLHGGSKSQRLARMLAQAVVLHRPDGFKYRARFLT